MHPRVGVVAVAALVEAVAVVVLGGDASSAAPPALRRRCRRGRSRELERVRTEREVGKRPRAVAGCERRAVEAALQPCQWPRSSRTRTSRAAASSRRPRAGPVTRASCSARRCRASTCAQRGPVEVGAVVRAGHERRRSPSCVSVRAVNGIVSVPSGPFGAAARRTTAGLPGLDESALERRRRRRADPEARRPHASNAVGPLTRLVSSTRTVQVRSSAKLPAMSVAPGRVSVWLPSVVCNVWPLVQARTPGVHRALERRAGRHAPVEPRPGCCRQEGVPGA